MMKLSIIIPAYNAEKTIESCIMSLVKQSEKFYEIIVIDDGSTDNTTKIVNEIASSHSEIKLITNDNHGVSYSRNCGIKAATGDYVTFIDADDYLELNMVSSINKFLSKDYDFIRFNFNNVGGKGFNNNLFELSNLELDLENDKEQILKHLLTSKEKIPNLVMLLVIKKEIIDLISFNEELFMMEDVDFYTQLCLVSKKCYFLDTKLYNYCINMDSVTHSKRNYEKNIFGIIKTNRNIINRINFLLDKKIIKSINCNHVRVIANFLLLSNNKKNVKIILDKLYINKDFINMLYDSNYYGLSFKDKLFLLLLKCKNKFLIISYIKLLNLVRRGIK